MAEKVIGYIAVAGEGKGIAALGKQHFESKVLWFGRGATLFPTRQAVRNAVNRTRRYAKKHGLPWTWWNRYYIERVFSNI